MIEQNTRSESLKSTVNFNRRVIGYNDALHEAAYHFRMQVRYLMIDHIVPL